MFMCCHQTAGQNSYIKVANKSFANVAKFKYLGIMVTNQNRINEKIKADQFQGILAKNTVQNLLSSHLLPKLHEDKA